MTLTIMAFYEKNGRNKMEGNNNQNDQKDKKKIMNCCRSDIAKILLQNMSLPAEMKKKWIDDKGIIHIGIIPFLLEEKLL